MKEFQMINILKIIFSNARKIAWIGFFTALISSIIVLFIVEPKYESHAKILPSSGSQSSASGLAGIAAGFGVALPIDGDQTIFSSDLYASIILSNKFLENILSNSFFDHKTKSQKNLKEIIIPNKNDISDFEHTKLAVEKLQKTVIKVFKDPKTGIVTIITTTTNREFSRELCEVIVKDLNEFQQNFNIEKAKRKKIFIEKRIEEVETELSKIETELSNFYLSNINYSSSPNLVIELNRIQTKYDVSKGVFITLNQEYETAKIEEVKESEFLKIIDEPSLALRKSSPQRKKVVFMWTLLSIVVSSVIILFRRSADFMNYSDISNIRELKNILKNQFKL